jgi:hypothetical protein
MNALTGLLAVVGFFAVGGLLLEGLKPAAHTMIGPEKHHSSSSSSSHHSSTKKGGRRHSKKHTRKHSH